MNQAENELLEPEVTEEEAEEVEQVEGEQPDPEAEPGAEAAADEVVVTIGEESPPSDEEEHRAPEWVRELRKSNREKDRRIRELEQAQVKAVAAPEAVGAKPTLEACEYDADRFERDLEAWHQRKRDADAEDRKRQEGAQAAQAAWQAKLESYGKLKGDLKVKDFEDAEMAIQETLSVTQQGVILQGSENPALVVYALGKNPKKAKELAAITDPVKFAFATAKLEMQLKVTPRKSAPLPETRVRGSAPVSGTVDSTLERLRTEAGKTGDFTKVIQYKQQQRNRKT